MKSITAEELQKRIENSNDDIQIIDVREAYEYEAQNMGAELIPLGSIPENVDKISKVKDVIIHCRSGVRSANAIAFLESNYVFQNLYNLEGGILAWEQLLKK
jgi:adenylyltransferase/sulfurtransferase